MLNYIPKLLVSVRDASEALDAVVGGADWIDLKEPLMGPLGPVSSVVAREVVTEVGGLRPLSAALGELVDWQESDSKGLLGIEGIGVVKLGLADCAGKDWFPRWLRIFAEAQSAGMQLAAVVYADWIEAGAPSPDEVLESAKLAGGEYLLVDTWNKSGPSTLHVLGVKNLCNILLSARRNGIKTVLAGKISINDLSSLSSLPVDIVAVRSAVCSAGREGRMEAKLVKQFHDHLCLATSNSELVMSSCAPLSKEFP
jgi:(5-formylfuran-3-yl)methyl phosphate synthase